MNLNTQKVLVTGSAGFIGSHLTEALVRRGVHVRAFVRYNSLNTWGWLDTLPQEIRAHLDVFSGDIRDPYGVKRAMEGCQVVMHLAALISIPYSYQLPQTFVDTNITGTLNVLQAGRELGVEKIIQTSTSEVYGTARFVPITEEHPLQGQSPYAASKIGADQLGLSFYHAFQTPVAIIRPFNTYGPRQSVRAVIPTIITQLVSGTRLLTLGALHPTRDFNYVSDTVNGFIAVAEAEHAVGEVLNIGSNFEISIRETALLIAELVGVTVEFATDTQRLRPQGSEVERLWADPTKAQRLTGWEPEYAGRAGLQRGLQNTIEWFMNPEHLKSYKIDRYTV
jgi:NAD dependent epimerase/dehydratase